MACFHPLRAWRGAPGPFFGRMVFDATKGFGPQVDLPCGQCIGCRLERSRQWAVRCMHEAQLHDESCFVTLTYRQADLPRNGSLDKSHYQLFMKRLRARFPYKTIRYFQCGEYGEGFLRPHYHACLFGFDFPDKVFYTTAGGNRLYTSALLDELWRFGFCSIGAVTFESAAYVARYVTKKVTGDRAEAHYGERMPEYVTMSRRPGLARLWYDKFGSEVFPNDEVVVRGVVCRPPRYYDKLFSDAHGVEFEALKRDRVLKALAYKDNNTRERLAVREKVQESRFRQLKRGFES